MTVPVRRKGDRWVPPVKPAPVVVKPVKAPAKRKPATPKTDSAK